MARIIEPNIENVTFVSLHTANLYSALSAAIGVFIGAWLF